MSSSWQTFIRGAAGRQLIDTPALNPTSRQMLVAVNRPNVPAPIKVSGPGPKESHRENKAPVRSNTLVETGNLLGEDKQPNVIEDEEDEGEEEEALNPHVKPEQVSQDPYAGLDTVFGNHGDKTDGLQSAASQTSFEGDPQQSPPGSEPAKPTKNAKFPQSVAAFNQISQLGL